MASAFEIYFIEKIINSYNLQQKHIIQFLKHMMFENINTCSSLCFIGNQ